MLQPSKLPPSTPGLRSPCLPWSAASRPLALAALVLAASLSAACGDSGGGTTGAPPSTTSAAKSATPAPTASTANSSATPADTASAAPSGTASAAPSGTSSASPSLSGLAPVSSAGPSPSGEVKGEQKGGPSYSAYMGGAKSYKAGKPGALFVVVNALDGYHVNPTYKYKMKMDAPPSGVSFASETVTDASKSEKSATLSIPFTPSAPGSYTMTGTCSLSVCTDANCVVDKVGLSVTVKVE